MSITMAVLLFVATLVLMSLILWSFANDGPVAQFCKRALLLLGVYAFGMTSAIAFVAGYGYHGGYLALANVADDYDKHDHMAYLMQDDLPPPQPQYPHDRSQHRQ